VQHCEPAGADRRDVDLVARRDKTRAAEDMPGLDGEPGRGGGRRAMKRRRVMPSCASMWISVGAGGLS